MKYVALQQWPQNTWYPVLWMECLVMLNYTTLLLQHNHISISPRCSSVCTSINNWYVLLTFVFPKIYGKIWSVYWLGHIWAHKSECYVKFYLDGHVQWWNTVIRFQPKAAKDSSIGWSHTVRWCRKQGWESWYHTKGGRLIICHYGKSEICGSRTWFRF